MNLGEKKIDVKVREEGDWVGEKYGTPIPEMGELCLKTRGAENKAWRRLQSQLINSIPRARRVRNTLDPDDQDAINAKLLRDAALLDWDGPTNPDGSPLPFSKEQAFAFLTNPETGFLAAAQFAASIVAEVKQEEIEGDEKN